MGCLESDEFYVLIINFAYKIVTLCSVEILYFLNFINENIQVTECGMVVSPVLDGGRWLGSRFDLYFNGDITPDTRSVGGWMGPSASLGVLEKR